MQNLVYYADNQRHLVCKPYSVENLHRMAENLGIKRCWFHKDHYDIPKRKISFVRNIAINVTSREILEIINTVH
jgi:hypothetical protein